MGWENSVFSSINSEHRWVDEISKYFEHEVALNINEVPVSIFHVPKSMSAVKPEAYVPQFIGLGPYHHTRTDLYDMERYKLAAVTSFLKPHHNQNFQQLLIDKLIEFEPFVRACYHKYLDLDPHTLAWIMAIDGLFLLNILSNYNDGKSSDGRVQVLTQDAVFYRDAMVLENQIPVILLKEIRKRLQLTSSNDNDDSELFFMLRGFCEAICPFKLAKTNLETLSGTSCLHLVDLMYNLIINHRTIKQSVVHIQEPHDENTTIPVQGREEEEGSMIKNMEEIIEVGMSLGIGRKILRPIKVVQNMPWDSISNLLGLKSCKANEPATSPLIEEIKIPSVTHLHKYGGIKFSHTVGGIRDLKFVEEEATLYLPVLTLNTNSEVILRNLVAYEVAIASDASLELSQYIDLMSGIIDTVEDARYLKEKGIIKGVLSNEKIADLFNGMNKCSGKGSNETVEKINEYYNNRPVVKLNHFLKKNIYSSWKLLTLLPTASILLLLLLQSVSEVYGIWDTQI